MADEEQKPAEGAEGASGQGRRQFLSTTGLAIGAGLAGATVAGCKEEHEEEGEGEREGEGAHEGEAGHLSAEVAPGQLDDYYGLWSGGQSGEIRILGIPSMRELKRVPVFGRDPCTGWGATDFSKQLLRGGTTGDTHHVHPSYAGGTYDGKYIFVNDKHHARLARVRVDTMECDRIVDIPNAQGTHGIFPQRHRTGYVMCNSEFQTPLPNDGRDMGDKTKYAALHTAIDGETMEV